jgi:hypothetical protein
MIVTLTMDRGDWRDQAYCYNYAKSLFAVESIRCVAGTAKELSAVPHEHNSEATPQPQIFGLLRVERTDFGDEDRMLMQFQDPDAQQHFMCRPSSTIT